MAAGMTQLLFARELRPYDELERRARTLLETMGTTAAQLGVPFWGDAAGAMFGWHFVEGPVHDFATAASADSDLFARFHRAALQRGVFLPASPFEAAFLSTAHTPEIVADAAQQLSAALREAAR
jgi:glutamate-1-semialdehyde 2,1-aminomutase